MQYTLDSLTDWPEAQDEASPEERLARQLEMFVEVLQSEAGGPRGYRLRRILLTNFWLYGTQEFEIPHGRLFLAGENASGKSTVLTESNRTGVHSCASNSPQPCARETGRTWYHRAATLYAARFHSRYRLRQCRSRAH